MKLKLLAATLLICASAQAQWTTGTSPYTTSNTNNGTVDVKGFNTTSAPSLHVYNTTLNGTASGAKVELMRFSAPGGTSMYNVAALFAKTNGTSPTPSYLSINPLNTGGSAFVEGLTIASGGNVGVGTPSPAARLSVYQNTTGDYVNATQINSINPNIHWPLVISTNSKMNHSGFVSSSASDIYLLLREQNGNANVQLHPSGNTYFNGGNVGIGTNIPSSLLHLKNSTGTVTSTIESGGSSTRYAQLAFSDNGTTLGYVWVVPQSNIMAIGKGGHQHINMNLSNNRVGIGTTNPSGKLHVNGCTYIGNANEDALFRVSLGSSGGDYGSVGYGYLYSNTTGAHTYAVADYASQIRFNSGGFTFLTAPIGTTAGDPVSFSTAMTIFRDGKVGIGTTDTKGNKLGVNGTIIANEITVKVYPWSDYVFADGYKLPSLSETESFIKEHKHLPDVPSAAEVEANGVKVGEMEAILLKKIEELTLLMIEQNKQLQQQAEEIKNLSDQIKSK